MTTCPCSIVPNFDHDRLAAGVPTACTSLVLAVVPTAAKLRLKKRPNLELLILGNLGKTHGTFTLAGSFSPSPLVRLSPSAVYSGMKLTHK